jgi:hypothetical protein
VHKNEQQNQEEVDGLCPECGHGFKSYLDRVLGEDVRESELKKTLTCPVCGCGECQILHPGSS